MQSPIMNTPITMNKWRNRFLIGVLVSSLLPMVSLASVIGSWEQKRTGGELFFWPYAVYEVGNSSLIESATLRGKAGYNLLGFYASGEIALQNSLFEFLTPFIAVSGGTVWTVKNVAAQFGLEAQLSKHLDIRIGAAYGKFGMGSENTDDVFVGYKPIVGILYRIGS